MYKFFKPFLFLLAPESAHRFTIVLARIGFGIPLLGTFLKNYYTITHKSLRRDLFGLHFKNPIGLAAGFDKDGKYIHLMSKLGFGFVEIGTITPEPQVGNPQPRLFRLKKDRAIINRMGFNNEGVDAIVKRLQKGKPKGLIIGGNIGKNKSTPNENASSDYIYAFEQLFPYVDYFVVNVSSPNTPGLRELQEKEPLTQLLSLLQNLNRQKEKPLPVFLKIAPDLTSAQLDDIIEIVEKTKMAGIIATNTTIDRSGLEEEDASIKAIGMGGLSGQPLKDRSTEVIRYLYQRSKGKISIIGVGGIASAEDVKEKLDAGASLVQIYTGLIYEGPALIRKINKALIE